jgi:hypothetical protein
MYKKYAEKLINFAKEKIENCVKSESMRLEPKAFIRDSVLGAKNILNIILRGSKASLQISLDHLYDNGTLCKSVSKAAFSKARKAINPEYVREFADGSAEIYVSEVPAETYKGKRIIALDGSDIALENQKELIEYFGCSGSKRNAATALGSYAYDVNSEIVYDCRIAKYAASERALASMHIERLAELGLFGSVILADRGYPSYDFMAELIDNGFDFLVRIPKSWRILVVLLEENPDENDFYFELNNQRYDFRAYRVTLDNGEYEWLVTSLDAETLSADEAKELYAKRWGIEVKYGFVKNKLQLENFSGKTVIAVKQEFYATVYLANLCTAVTKVADAEIKNDDLKKLSNIQDKQTELASLTELLLFLSPLCASQASRNATKY